MNAFPNASSWDKEVVLAWLLYRMSQETRRDLANDLPQSYNRLSLYGPIVKVVRVHDGEAV